MKEATQETLLLPGEIGKIETLINDPGANRKGIALIAHPHPLYGGTFENKVVQTLAKTFVELGCVAIRPNFRGIGKSEGEHDHGNGETEDLIKVLQWAQEEYGDLPVVLAGFSFGGFVQLRVFQRVGSIKLVLVAPAVGRLKEIPGDYDFEGDVPSSTLLIHGSEDEVVPLTSVVDWAKSKNLPIVLFPGAGHFFHGKLTELKNVIIRDCINLFSSHSH